MKTVVCGRANCFAAALVRGQPPEPVRPAPSGVPWAPGVIAVFTVELFRRPESAHIQPTSGGALDVIPPDGRTLVN